MHDAARHAAKTNSLVIIISFPACAVGRGLARCSVCANKYLDDTFGMCELISISPEVSRKRRPSGIRWRPDMLKIVSSNPAPKPTFAMLQQIAEDAADDGDYRTARVAVAAIRNRWPEQRTTANAIEAEIGSVNFLRVVR